MAPRRGFATRLELAAVARGEAGVALRPRRGVGSRSARLAGALRWRCERKHIAAGRPCRWSRSECRRRDDLGRRLVVAEAQVRRMPQATLIGDLRIADLRHQRRRHPVRAPGQRRGSVGKRAGPGRQPLEHAPQPIDLVAIEAGTHVTDIAERAVLRVVSGTCAEDQRAESLPVRPAVRCTRTRRTRPRAAASASATPGCVVPCGMAIAPA